MAEGSAGHRGWLRGEVEAWVRAGLVSDSQASAILARYPAAAGDVVRTQTQKRIAVVFAVLGAVLVGLGIILFFATNWQAIPRWAKLGIVLASTIGAYVSGYWLRYGRGYPAVGSALLLLGGLLYGAGIFLIGQMFHVQAEPHYGLLLWAAGLLPLAYLLPHPPLITLVAVLLAVWVGAVSFFGLERYNVSDATFPIRNLVAAGIILYGVGRLHRLGRPHVVTGGLVILLAYFLYTTMIRGFFGPSGEGMPSSLMLLQAGLLVGALATLVGTILLAPDRRRSMAEAAGLGALLVTVWLIRPAPLSSGGPGTYWLWIVLVNLVLFGVCLGAVALGVGRNDRALVNLGLVFFALGIAARYIDVIGRLLTTSLFFIGGGVLLLGGGWLIERTRRRLLHRMGAGADAP